MSELPDPGTVRWVASRKAQIVTAIARGHITAEEACRRYALSGDELAEWSRRMDDAGINGLKIKHTRWDPPARRRGAK